MKIQLLILCLITPAGIASAGVPARPFCHTVEEVKQHIAFCEENRFFPEASAACVSRFDQKVASYRQLLAASFRANSMASNSAQQLRMDNSSKDLRQADASLKDLIATGNQVRQELVQYVNSMDRPGMPSAAILENVAVNNILSSVPCYLNNRLALEDHIRTMERKIAELKTADQVAVKIDTTVNQNLGQLKSMNQKSVAATANGVTPKAKIPSAASPKQKSTITGEIKSQKIK